MAAGDLKTCCSKVGWRICLAILAGVCLSACASAPPVVSHPAPAVVSQRQEIGRSVQDQPIELIRIGSGGGAILVIAGIHGDEPASCFVADRLAEVLRASPGGTVYIVPCANPDGREAKTRTNAHKVDLNRNFP